MKLLTQINQKKVQGGGMMLVLTGTATALAGAVLIWMSIQKKRQQRANIAEIR